MNNPPSLTLTDVSLILETNNLRGDTADSLAVFNSLQALLKQLNQQDIAVSKLGEFIITHDGIPEASQQKLTRLISSPIKFVLIPADCGYYQAKNLGFQASSKSIVVFADADCTPDHCWLSNLITPLLEDKKANIGAVAGRTTYQDNLLGSAATTIDFMYFPYKTYQGRRYEGATRNFYANNIAFRRTVFQRHAYGEADNVYRGHCQMLGLRLLQAGVQIQYAHQAHTTHAFPNSLKDLVRLRLLRGQDTLGLTPALVKTYLSKKWQWLSHTGPIMPLIILNIRWWCSLTSIGKQGLKVTWYQWPLVALIMSAISSLDMLGAFFMGIHLPLQATGKNADAMALDYTKK